MNTSARSEYWQRWAAANRDRIHAYWAARRKDPIAGAALRARERARANKNIERRRASGRKWKAANRSKLKAWKVANRDIVNESCRRREALKRMTATEHVDYAQIRRESDGTCGICRQLIRVYDQVHFDHIVPLARGGTHTRDNIQIAHAVCNMTKATKVAVKHA